jgi:predicted anti-sigma-YlaC factor YlaD
MNRYDCDTIRDLLPAFVRGELLPHETASADAHLQECDECREERSLVALMQDVLVPVPAGLEARVVMAVRAAPAFAPRRWTPGRLAMAATLAAAVIGGSAMFNHLTFDRTSIQSASNAEQVAELSWAAAELPMLHGGSNLEDLTVEELEILLAELES